MSKPPPTTRHRRQRSDSVDAEVAAYQAVTRQIDPLEPLPAGLMPIWREIVEMRAAAEWSSLDLRLAHSLVIALADLRSQEKQLAREAKVSESPHGPVVNPRFTLIDRLSARILKLQMRLLLSPRSSGYRADRTEHARRVEREARARVDPIGEFLANGGDPTALLLGGDQAILFGEILPGGGDDAVEMIRQRMRELRGNGKRPAQ